MTWRRVLSELERYVGKGRSGSVYRHHDDAGREVVRKVFGGDTASKIVLIALTGAPNPYVWLEDVILMSEYRRRILADLVPFWFGDQLRLPETYGTSFSQVELAYQIHTEFIRGIHVPLRHRHVRPSRNLIKQLVTRIMKPLQSRLRESGFDGLVWQAGLGNPVASNNFMLERKPNGDHRWVWIDLESGVPALFAMNPLATLTYYLPKCLKHRSWLFDHTDIDAVRDYLAKQKQPLIDALTQERYDQMLQHVDLLQTHQQNWMQLRRHERSIGYALAKNQLTEQRADYWRKRPIRWTARLVAVSAFSGAKKILSKSVDVARSIINLNWGGYARSTAGFCVSQRYREHIARRFVARRIQSWRKRGAITADTARRFRTTLKSDYSSTYITDFGVHVAIKPFVKSLEYGLMPALFAAELVNGPTVVIFAAAGGIVARTAYTTGRLIQSIYRNRPQPWVALGVGILPIVGNAAYPAQYLYHSQQHGLGLSRFILYDLFATLGRKIPIWGGADTLTEHFFNAKVDLLVRPWVRPGLRKAIRNQLALAAKDVHVEVQVLPNEEITQAPTPEKAYAPNND